MSFDSIILILGLSALSYRVIHAVVFEINLRQVGRKIRSRLAVAEQQTEIINSARATE